MRVSIIAPMYEEAALLPRFLDAIEPLLAGDRKGVELVLVDGGSGDAGTEIAEARGHRVLSARRGRASQMNAGAAVASGDLLFFLHVDTVPGAGAVAALREAVRGGAVGGWFSVRLDSTRPLLWLTGRLISWRSRLTGAATGDQGIFATREAFQGLGGYAELPLFEDIDLCRRLRRVGRVAALSPAVTTSARRWERRGVWPTILRMWALRGLYHLGVAPERLARYYGMAR